MNRIDYERKDYKQLAKEFGGLRIGKHVVHFFLRDPNGKIHKLVQITSLKGWITDPKEVERVVRENGMEL